MITSLLPCPFCGNEAHASGCFLDGHYQVICSECRAVIKSDREDKAQGMWNQRFGLNPITQTYATTEEESDRELEVRTAKNMDLLSAFIDHVKEEAGIEIPEHALLSFFDA